MSESEIVAAIRPLIAAFDMLDIPYFIGGSIASSAFGMARSTLDIDIIAPVPASAVDSLVVLLKDAYYVSETAVRDAIARRSSFNLVHLKTMLKVDVFVLKDHPYDRQAFERRIAERLDPKADPPALFYLAAAEDIVLNKLNWFQMGGQVSERQWADVIGVLKVQQGTLDMHYLRSWAGQLGLMPLLDKALAEAYRDDTEQK